MSRALSEIFGSIFVNYPRALFNKDRTIVKPDFEEAISVISKAIEPSHPYMKPSYGTGSGNMTFTPYLSILHSDETNTTMKGVYCVYLFRADMKGVYLTLNQGVGYDGRTAPSAADVETVVETSHKIQDYYTTNSDLEAKGFRFGDEVELASPGRSGQDYERSTIAYKFYNAKSLPADAELITDLDSLLEIYEDFVKNKGKVLASTSALAPPAVYPSPSSIAPQTPQPLPLISAVAGESEDFPTFLKKRVLFFDPETVENYLLSLKVKPFVILTGNSGTGKTRLAQHFAEYLWRKISRTPTRSIIVDVKVGKAVSNKGWTFEKDSFIEEYPVLKGFNNRSYDIEIEGIRGRGDLTLGMRMWFANYEELREKNKRIIDRLTELASKDPVGRVGLKIHIPGVERETYEVVPVGPNWTENRFIVGFHNVLTQKYVKTQALDLILEAIKDDNRAVPFFIILDEMNLSHVERYFSDFLSALESDRPIPLHNSKEPLDGVQKEISLTDNIFVVGTVNVDETTYMFSPKVLDRANTLETRGADVSSYMSSGSTEKRYSGSIEYLENPLSDVELRKANISELKSMLSGVAVPGGASLWDELQMELSRFQRVLKEVRFEFGFRTINEIVRFMLVAWKYEGKPGMWGTWTRYFDAQIMQKMLPKLHGSQREVGDVLRKLYALCRTDVPTKYPRDYYDNETSPDVIYKSSAAKLSDMDRILDTQRYVSFTR